MIPAFDPEGGAALVVLRGGADAGLISAFGSLLALVWLPPFQASGRAAARLQGGLRLVAGLSTGAAIVLAVGWLLGESADMAGTVRAVTEVLRETLFGQVVAARLGFLAGAGVSLAIGWHRLAVFAGALAIASQAGHDHAWAMSGGMSVLLVSNVVHLMAAGAWLGGLVPLLVVVAAAPAEDAVLACQRFSILGTGCVVLIVATALFQASVMVGTWPGLLGTAYGWVICGKGLLLSVLVGFAAWNRFRLAPAFERGGTRGALLRSIGMETGAGVLVVLAAALLTSLQPGMDM